MDEPSQFVCQSISWGCSRNKLPIVLKSSKLNERRREREKKVLPPFEQQIYFWINPNLWLLLLLKAPWQSVLLFSSSFLSSLLTSNRILDAFSLPLPALALYYSLPFSTSFVISNKLFSSLTFNSVSQQLACSIKSPDEKGMVSLILKTGNVFDSFYWMKI